MPMNMTHLIKGLPLSVCYTLGSAGGAQGRSGSRRDTDDAHHAGTMSSMLTFKNDVSCSLGRHSVSETARLRSLFIFLVSALKKLKLGPREILLLGKCVPCKHTELSCRLRIHISKGMVVYAGNPKAGEVEARGWDPGAHCPVT